MTTERDVSQYPVIDNFGIYKEQALQVEHLDHQTEIELGTKIQAGIQAFKCIQKNEFMQEDLEYYNQQVADGQAAKDTLILANTRLVVHWAGKYYQKLPKSARPKLLDLIQEGNIGLINAAVKYNPEKINEDTGRPFRFSTYATWWIKQRISREITYNSRGIRIPVYVAEQSKLIYKLSLNLEQQLGHLPTPADIVKAVEQDEKLLEKFKSNEIEVTEEAIREIIEIDNLTNYNFSLDGNPDENSDWNLEDIIEDPDSNTDKNGELLNFELQEAINSLDPHLQNVLTLRFGLNGEGPFTLLEVAEKLEISREWVRQQEMEAIRELRKKLGVKTQLIFRHFI